MCIYVVQGEHVSARLSDLVQCTSVASARVYHTSRQRCFDVVVVVVVVVDFDDVM